MNYPDCTKRAGRNRQQLFQKIDLAYRNLKDGDCPTLFLGVKPRTFLNFHPSK